MGATCWKKTTLRLVVAIHAGTCKLSISINETEQNMDVIDTRDLQDRLEEIQTELVLNLEILTAEEAKELQAERAEILAVKEEVDGYAGDTFQDGVQLIAMEDFPEYIQELLEDTGDVPKLPWYVEVDWAATADHLRVDYTEVEFQGTTYLFR